MQTANVDVPIVITGRHIDVTDAIRDYVQRKIDGIHLDYPRIIEAKVVLDVHAHQNNRHFAEIVLFCANHIHIEASSHSDDLYAAIDETVSKIARRMRKRKTRLLKNHRPRSISIRHFDEHVFAVDFQDHPEHHEIEPLVIHRENYKLRPLYPDEAITEMELSERDFIIFLNQKSHEVCVLFRRKDGDYGMIGINDQAAEAA